MLTAIGFLLAIQATPVEELRIGVASGEEQYQFFEIRMIDVSPRDEIFVANAGTSEIRVYGFDGVYRRSMGSEGDGPGEFRRIQTLRVSDSAVIVQDLNEIEVFSHVGEHQTSVPYPRAVRGRLLGIGPNLWIFLTTRLECIEPGRACPRSLFVEAVDPFDGSRDVIVGPLSGERLTLIRPEQSDGRMIPGFFGPPVFESAGHVAAGTNGEFYVADSRSLSVRVYSPAGALLRQVQREHEPVSVSENLLEAVRECMRERRIADSAIEQRLAQHADTLPAITDLLVNLDGGLWIRRGDVGDAPVNDACYGGTATSTWDRFDSSAAYVGSTILPANFRALRLTTSGVLGVLTDNRGVEFVVYLIIP